MKGSSSFLKIFNLSIIFLKHQIMKKSINDNILDLHVCNLNILCIHIFIFLFLIVKVDILKCISIMFRHPAELASFDEILKSWYWFERL